MIVSKSNDLLKTVLVNDCYDNSKSIKDPDNDYKEQFFFLNNMKLTAFFSQLLHFLLHSKERKNLVTDGRDKTLLSKLLFSV